MFRTLTRSVIKHQLNENMHNSQVNTQKSKSEKLSASTRPPITLCQHFSDLHNWSLVEFRFAVHNKISLSRCYSHCFIYLPLEATMETSDHFHWEFLLLTIAMHCVLVGSAPTVVTPPSHSSNLRSAPVLRNKHFLLFRLHTQFVFQSGGTLDTQSCIRQRYYHSPLHSQKSSTCNHPFHSFCFSKAPTWHHFWLSFQPSLWLSHPSPWKFQSLCKLLSSSLSVLQQWDRSLMAILRF